MATNREKGLIKQALDALFELSGEVALPLAKDELLSIRNLFNDILRRQDMLDDRINESDTVWNNWEDCKMTKFDALRRAFEERAHAVQAAHRKLYDAISVLEKKLDDMLNARMLDITSMSSSEIDNSPPDYELDEDGD